jgi:hypothetical protein
MQPSTEGKKKPRAGHSLLRLIELHKYYRQLTKSQHISSITTMAPQMEKNRMYAMQMSNQNNMYTQKSIVSLSRLDNNTKKLYLHLSLPPPNLRDK